MLKSSLLIKRALMHFNEDFCYSHFRHQDFNFYCKCILVQNIGYLSPWLLIIGIGPEKTYRSIPITFHSANRSPWNPTHCSFKNIYLITSCISRSSFMIEYLLITISLIFIQFHITLIDSFSRKKTNGRRNAYLCSKMCILNFLPFLVVCSLASATQRRVGTPKHIN